MITLKKIDFYGQIFLIFLTIILAVCLQETAVVFGYFITGCWQVLSTIIQACINKKLPELRERKYYQIITVIIILTSPLGAWLILFIAPVVAFWYLNISYRELKIWQHRRFIQLR